MDNRTINRLKRSYEEAKECNAGRCFVDTDDLENVISCIDRVTELEKENAELRKVEPRKHGHWIESGKFDKHDNKYGRHDYVCSECRGVAINFVGGTEDWWCFHKPKYCPYCGAKMDGKDESDGN